MIHNPILIFRDQNLLGHQLGSSRESPTVTILADFVKKKEKEKKQTLSYKSCQQLDLILNVTQINITHFDQ